MQQIISFPHLGNYHVPVENLLIHLFPQHIIRPAPRITKRTLELGSLHSPDFVCVPFKYNLGNFIEALEEGATILVQAGGGCRYGYYAEVQEQILRDLGYQFELIKLLSNSVEPLQLYAIAKKIGCPLSFSQFIYYVLLAIQMVKQMDRLEAYIRENIGFEVTPGSFEILHTRLLQDLKQVDTLQQLHEISRRYDRQLRQIPIQKPANCLKVGLIGELYTLMEPFSNFFLEKELAKHQIQVSRFITVTFLLFEKSKMRPKILQSAGQYLEYHIGADGTDSVERCKALAEQGYDGMIHVKPFGCIPEINAMPMLQKISHDYQIPVLYFSFDSQTSETGVKTRLEAFTDMLWMRKERML